MPNYRVCLAPSRAHDAAGPAEPATLFDVEAENVEQAKTQALAWAGANGHVPNVTQVLRRGGWYSGQGWAYGVVWSINGAAPNE